MRFIGITGGVGAGKSAILAHLASKPGIRVMLADEIAHDLMQPGTECFQKLKEKFAGEDIYQPDGSLDRAQLATVIFSIFLRPTLKLEISIRSLPSSFFFNNSMVCFF